MRKFIKRSKVDFNFFTIYFTLFLFALNSTGLKKVPFTSSSKTLKTTNLRANTFWTKATNELCLQDQEIPTGDWMWSRHTHSIDTFRHIVKDIHIIQQILLIMMFIVHLHYFLLETTIKMSAIDHNQEVVEMV